MDMMPLVALVGGRILCMHGGLSQHIKSLDDLRNLRRYPFFSRTDFVSGTVKVCEELRVETYIYEKLPLG